MLNVTHILYINNLADNEYLELVTRSQDLIDALYSDNRIVNKSCLAPCPGIVRFVRIKYKIISYEF